MKLTKIALTIILSTHFFGATHAESVLDCQSAYKNCISDIADLFEPYADVYEFKPNICKNNLNKWRKLDYQFVHCQDTYIICNGEQEKLWEKIHKTADISLEQEQPENHGLTQNNTAKIYQSATNIPNLRSLLVSRRGKLIFEEYYSFKDDPKPHYVFSVTKSIMSILTGIAVDKGHIESENILIKPFFPKYYSQKHDERKDSITVKHLLTMSTGINFTDQTYWGNDLRKNVAWIRDDNARDWILNKDMLLTYQPGDTMLYGSPNIDLLATVLASATDQSVLAFAEKYLFEPLNIKNYLWLHDSQENYYGGYTLYLRPRAMIRIGQMILDGGTYKGKQIVSSQWLNKSLANHIPLGGEEGWEYGYLWWRGRIEGYQTISAMGWAGQFITLIPELKAVIVTTSDATICSLKEHEDQFWDVFNLVKEVITSIDK